MGIAKDDYIGKVSRNVTKSGRLGSVFRVTTGEQAAYRARMAAYERGQAKAA
jgi:hypothetical protein